MSSCGECRISKEFCTLYQDRWTTPYFVESIKATKNFGGANNSWLSWVAIRHAVLTGVIFFMTLDFVFFCKFCVNDTTCEHVT